MSKPETRTSKSVILLPALTSLLALVQAGVGLFSSGGSGPFPFTTLHGETVEMYGQGIYAFDTYFRAPIFRGTDAVTLFVAIPLLWIAILMARRGSLRGRLLLVGALGYFLYNSTSVALGTAYNNLFLVYIAYFSVSLFAFLAAFGAIDQNELAARVGPGFPRRGIATLMFVSGVALLVAWLGDIVSALVRGGVPAIDSYTTEVTHALDLGIITPVSVLGGIWVLRRKPLGYLLAAIILIVLAIIGVVVATQTVFQIQAGISLTTGEFIGKAGSFMVLALIAVYLTARYFQSIKSK